MRLTFSLVSLLAAFCLAACNEERNDSPDSGAEQPVANDVPAVTFAPDEEYNVSSKPGGPVRIAYRVVGTPIVGQPVTVDLRITSNVGARPVKLTYHSNDLTAMRFPESQLSSVSLALDDDHRGAAQQVTLIPLREGRLYLNVAAQLETDNGSLSTVTAIPIQVASVPRELEQNGAVVNDENGELLRSLPAAED